MRIGKYQIVQPLGAGGMGIVYKALDPDQGRSVAIKMIGSRADIRATVHANLVLRKAGALDMDRRMMLVREARLASELHHANIVRVFDYGQHGGLLYIVMEYLEGRSLDRVVLIREAVSLAQKIGMIAQICDALEFAHAHGVMHRDIKPANAFVLKTGKVKVLDFGLAAKLASPLPGKAGLAGTPNYIAPEIIRARSGYDARVDIWATGIAFYELLTGWPPFVGPSLTHTLYKIVHAPLPPLPKEIPQAAEIQKILSIALAKSPDRRYASAREFAGALRHLQGKLENQEIPSDNSRTADYAGQSQPSIYTPKAIQPDIGLQQTDNVVSVTSGEVALRRVVYKLRLGLSEEKVAGLAALSSVLLLTIDVVASLWQAPRAVVDTVGVLFVLSIFLAILRHLTALAVAKIALVPLVALEKLQETPRCHSCKSWMRRKTRWTRFALTDAAVSHGFADCIAALKENLWEDAAKLLSLHGDEFSPSITNSIVSPPIRYHLDFFECQPCGYQSARVTTEDKDDEDWIARTQFVEAYKASTTTRPRRSRVMNWIPAIGTLKSAAGAAIEQLSPAFRKILLLLSAVALFVLTFLTFTALVNFIGGF